MEKNVRMSLLFEFYRNMLTQRQLECVDLYYNEDLSLAEIAEHTGISRQGVRYAIKHAEESLLSYEDRIGLASKISLLNEKLEKAESIVKELKETHTHESTEFDRLLSLIQSAGIIMKE